MNNAVHVFVAPFQQVKPATLAEVLPILPHNVDRIPVVNIFKYDEVIAELVQFDLAVGPVYRPQDVLDDPHVRAIGQLVDLPYPGTPALAPIADFPLTLSETPGGAQRRAPTMGEHTDEVLDEIGLDPDEISALRAGNVV